jgi:hypothetical protein
MSGTRISSLLGKITVLVIICCFSLSAHAKYGGGTGEPNDPYLIYTAWQMNEIGLSGNWDDLDKHFLLCADIDLSAFTGTSFNIIGYFVGENSPDNKPFTGVFDGNGHTIANFTYNSNDRRRIGLFGYVSGENAEIKNLGLIDPNVDAGTGDYVGSLVGSLREGAVTGCYVQGGSIKGDNYVGGLVGTNSLYGLTIYGTITNCYSTASVSGNLFVGGLLGVNCESTITNCCSTGSVSGNRYVGGLAGEDYKGTITNCYSTASVSADYWVGGLVGYNSGGTITNCYAISSVEGKHYVGGLVGQNKTSWGEGAITNCYSAGKVSGNSSVGGLVGYKPGYVVNSFWDIEKSGQPTSASGIGKTTAQMMMADTFLHWGSCGELWTINEGVDYPRLTWQQRPGEPVVGIIPFEGDGVPNNPYLIYTADELNAIRLFPCVWDKHFKLMANIDLSQYTGTDFNIIVRFSGTFDGNGHTISNFNYISTDTSYIGLFGDVSGHIKNLGLIDPNLDTEEERNVGLLAGLLDNGAITNCYVEGGSVSGHVFIGGLVGRNNYGTISKCYSTGRVSGNTCVGGLVGRNNYGIITKCYSTASVSSVSEDAIGGLVGHNRFGTITNCYATGSVSGDDGIGGLVGSNWKATITNCYSIGSVSGDEDVGALVGYDREGSYTMSFWDKTINSLLTGIGNAVNSDVIGQSTAKMQTESTFTDAGWDFENVWRILEGAGYPRLWWEGMQVPMKLTPRTLNCRSYGLWLKAHLILPQGFTVADVDSNRPAVLHSFGIESAPLHVFVNGNDLVQIEAAFEREAICSLTGDWPQALTVVGFLTDGNIFLGTSTVRLIAPGAKDIEELASYWLNADCVYPDFCDRIDLNRDSLVNLLDYALLQNSQVEFVADE